MNGITAGGRDEESRVGFRRLNVWFGDPHLSGEPMKFKAGRATTFCVGVGTAKRIQVDPPNIVNYHYGGS
jgi:hypothetical protein